MLDLVRHGPNLIDRRAAQQPGPPGRASARRKLRGRRLRVLGLGGAKVALRGLVAAVERDGALPGREGIRIAPGSLVRDAEVVLDLRRLGQQTSGLLEVRDRARSVSAIEGPRPRRVEPRAGPGAAPGTENERGEPG